MRKTFILLFVALMLAGCSSNEEKAQNAAANYLKMQMKDPSSFKVEKSQVVLDKVPFFLDTDLLVAAYGVNYGLDQLKVYNNIPYTGNSYLESSKVAARKVYEDAITEMHEKYKLAKGKEKLEYIVLITCTAKNSLGGTVASQYVVIVDKDNPNNVLGSYAVDKDFINNVTAIYLHEDAEKGKLDRDQYGKLDDSKLSPAEALIWK